MESGDLALKKGETTGYYSSNRPLMAGYCSAGCYQVDPDDDEYERDFVLGDIILPNQ